MGGLLGGILASIFGLLFNKEDSKRMFTAVIALVLIIICAPIPKSLYKDMKLPRIIPLDTGELIEAVPVLEFIKMQDPVIYKELIYPIDKAARNRKVTQDTLNDFRKTYTSLLEAKKRTASIETLTAEHKLSIEFIEVMKNKTPIVCTQKLHGRPYEDVSGLVTQEYVAQEQQVMASFFTAKSRDTKVVSDIDAGKVIVTEMTRKIIQKLEITSLDPSPEDEIENKKVCDFHIMLNSEMIKLTDKDFIDVYGYRNSLNL